MTQKTLPIKPLITDAWLTLQISVREDKLVDALKIGSLSAFSYLYHRYSAALLGSIMRTVNQQETAEDLLQEVFIKIHQHIGRYDEKKGRLFTWMLNLARHAAIDQIRLVATKGRKKSEDIHDCLPIIDAFFNSGINTDLVGIKALLSNLNPNEQQILDLAYYKGFTHPEISELLNIPLGTVKTRIRSSIIKLRQFFAYQAKR